MQWFRFDTVDSTNDVAGRMLADGSISGRAVVVAREQTLGKGTHGRRWISPRDAGLYFSVVDSVRPGARIAARPDMTAYTLAAGVACAEVLVERTSLPVRLKPVNDLYLHGRKLGGILTEATIEAGALAALITGIGVNWHDRKLELPEGAAPATSVESWLAAMSFAALDKDCVIAELAERVLIWTQRVSKGDVGVVSSAWEAYKLSDAASSDSAPV